jgi:hypothetical protein
MQGLGLMGARREEPGRRSWEVRELDPEWQCGTLARYRKETGGEAPHPAMVVRLVNAVSGLPAGHVDLRDTTRAQARPHPAPPGQGG